MYYPWQLPGSDSYGGIVDEIAHPAWFTSYTFQAASVSGTLKVAFVDIWGQQLPNKQYTLTVDNSKVWTLGDLLSLTTVDPQTKSSMAPFGYVEFPDGAQGAICLAGGSGYINLGFGGSTDGLDAHIMAGTTPFIPLKPGTLFTIGRVHKFNFNLLP